MYKVKLKLHTFLKNNAWILNIVLWYNEASESHNTKALESSIQINMATNKTKEE